MALISCTDCNREVSDRAHACPNCGAPVRAPASTTATAPAALEVPPAAPSGNGMTCPFSGHLIPEGATVCVCGAYYGYKDTKAPRTFKVGVILSAVALLGFLAGGFGIVMGVMFGIVGAPLAIANYLALKRGPQWWRSF